jgi:FMN phosphatase YigB (HAD superfamily)
VRSSQTSKPIRWRSRSPLKGGRGIIFDLDNCLAAADEVSEQLFQPAFDAIRAANRGTLAPEALEAALRDCWVHSLDFVAAKHGFSESMLEAGWQAFLDIEVREPMRGYGDLEILPDLGELRFLVTSGFRRLQESKIRALGIAPLFDAIVIDAIDEADRRGKQQIFADLWASFDLRPEEALVVGDNPDSEIEAGRRLGIATVQILRAGVVRASSASDHVRDLAELRRRLGPRA